MEVRFIEFQKHGDDRGALIALEQDINIPFDIKRVYYLFNTEKDIRRGMHAHKNLRQLAVAVKGSVRFLLDNGTEKIELLLDNPSQGLYIGPGVWREMYSFSDDCVLMILADHVYEESDYIRDYDLFIKSVVKK
ncbi:sugar 3,4-ketoisomerase [Alkalimarinus alittae]|uniref:FdtA/QdtA family cupin domain-containing protein n=1 Tax=Alkalimarinus alittae TaxID=2961619 RepID=A0ABY6N612_9ALTE|nr:FdtA/QdtA family cupin domain-containing protein [Alkalimarinus alittae]UZE97551.1 FdtA/QdtA family cupin domain-containing protein [Alkalimarinus alittae]